MNTTLRLAVVVALAFASLSHASAQDTTATIDDALSAYQAEDYKTCADTLTALQEHGQAMPQGLELFYVECLAAADRSNEALAYLKKELPAGHIDLDELKTKDRPGLNKLRAGPRWGATLAEAEKETAVLQAKMDQPLRQELLARYEKDQAVRKEAIDEGGGPEAWEQTAPVDKANTAWLKSVVAEKGWPTRSMVGAEGASAAFYIAQHATHDPAFQEQVLGFLEAAMKKDEADPGQFAMLKDRVLRQQGKPQIYGTQFTTNADGTLSMQPTEDLPGLNKRRESVGLPSIEEYKRGMSELYKRKVN